MGRVCRGSTRAYNLLTFAGQAKGDEMAIHDLTPEKTRPKCFSNNLKRAKGTTGRPRFVNPLAVEIRRRGPWSSLTRVWIGVSWGRVSFAGLWRLRGGDGWLRRW